MFCAAKKFFFGSFFFQEKGTPVRRGRLPGKGRKKAGALRLPFCDVILLILALLVGDRAGRLAGGLTRGLALTAAALGGAGLKSGPIESLDVLHWYLLLIHYLQLF